MTDHQDIKTKQTDDQMLISYMLLRKIIGGLAFLLPVVLAIGGIFYAKCDFIENSISDYYHTEMRNILVGTLCAVAMFMFAYNGHDHKDRNAGIVACLSALGVALFPTSVDKLSSCATKCIEYNCWIGIIHLGSALVFFVTLIYFSLKLFPLPRGKHTEMSAQKIKRNHVYKITGWVMIICVALIIIYFLIDDKFPKLADLKPVFVLEFIALWAFGISWLTKGQFFFKDK
ncbi:DUF7103 family protein [Hyunsoonleella rubra]|uniref:DUF998 domain-containing protein n=1 Tax=Hyunsoonleella rubra TaxID=1737062 RepID=A0ABW5TE70_9FLAO